MTPTRPLVCCGLPRVDYLLANRRNAQVYFDSNPGSTTSGVRCQLWVKQTPHKMNPKRSFFRVEVFLCPTQDVRNGRENVSLTIEAWCANVVLKQLGIDLPLDINALTDLIEAKDYPALKDLCLAVNRNLETATQ